MAITFRAYLDKMKVARGLMNGTIAQAVEAAMGNAVFSAAEATPPPADVERGTGTVTGDLRQSWATDSVVKPQVSGGHGGEVTFTTWLKNSVEYASYVNDGHRMNRHFVPGLYINPDSGLLEYDAKAKVGLVVGTKTTYVEGAFMTDKAKEAYRSSLERILRTKVEELLTE